jgi:hypothetical protein
MENEKKEKKENGKISTGVLPHSDSLLRYVRMEGLT